MFNLINVLMLIARPKICTKTSDIPSCKDCIHYIPSEYKDFDHLSECRKFEYFDQRTDHKEFPYAKVCRDKEFMCGLQGKFFIFNKELATDNSME